MPCLLLHRSTSSRAKPPFQQETRDKRRKFLRAATRNRGNAKFKKKRRKRKREKEKKKFVAPELKTWKCETKLKPGDLQYLQSPLSPCGLLRPHTRSPNAEGRTRKRAQSPELRAQSLLLQLPNSETRPVHLRPVTR
jgi:hypothetical protein